MLITGIVLIGLGVIVVSWMSRAMRLSLVDRPPILRKKTAVRILNSCWICLLGGGLYSLWLASPTVAVFFVGGYAMLWITGYWLASPKQRAKRFFRVYKQLRSMRPQAQEKELLRETASWYFQGRGWAEEDIVDALRTIFGDLEQKAQAENHMESVLRGIYEKSDRKVQDVKALLYSVWRYESVCVDQGLSYINNLRKIDAAIDSAHKKVFGMNA